MSTDRFPPRYRRFALAVLTCVYVFNFIDRQILVILQESIKQDLGLMDWQLGLLTGFAFAIFYATLGVPIARLADRHSRRNIISICLAIWSGMTALCGAVTSYWQLLLARVGVGIGEAGCSPPAHSMISDLYPPHERATAMSIYNMGIYFGMLIGILAGGWINEVLGWRWALVAVGLPGLLFALLIRTTLREPPRGLSEPDRQAAETPPAMGDVIALLWNRRSFRHMALAASLHAFASYGVGGWMAPFLQRVHELGSGETASWLGPIAAIPAALGAFFGGYLCDRWGKDDARVYIWVPAIAIVGAMPIQLAVYFVGDHRLAMVLYIIPVAMNATFLGPMLAMTHGLVSMRMRAVASSVLFLVFNLIGMGLGPLSLGILSDIFSSDVGPADGLRWALAIVTLANAWAGIHYYLASRDLRSDLARAPA